MGGKYFPFVSLINFVDGMWCCGDLFVVDLVPLSDHFDVYLAQINEVTSTMLSEFARILICSANFDCI